MTLVSGNFTVSQSFLNFDNQTFPDGGAPNAGADLDFRCTQPNRVARIGTAGIQEIAGNLAGLAEVPAPPYGFQAILSQAAGDVGRIFAVQTDQGRFAAFQITGFSANPVPTYTMQFKYQTDGSRTMQ